MLISQSIRKKLLDVFEQTLIPSLFSAEGPRLVLCEPPFCFLPEIKVRSLPAGVLREKPLRLGQLVQRWPRAKVNATQWPYLMFLCRGEMDLRIGITRKMAQVMAQYGQKVESGCLILSLKAPLVLLCPSGVPYADGTASHWERASKHTGQTEVVWTHFSSFGAICHSDQLTNGTVDSKHALLITDPLMTDAVRLLHDELRNCTMPGGAWPEQKVALAQLQVVMSRLQRRIKIDEPKIGSTAWSAPTMNREFSGSQRDVAILSDLHQYIQLHLREPLSLAQLTRQAGLSATQLNRIFRSNLDTTPMLYVARLRLEAARQILSDTPQYAVKEIMYLVGYNSLPHFSRTFTKAHNITPREFRKQRLEEINSRK